MEPSSTTSTKNSSDTLRRRFSRTLSIYDDTDSNVKTNGYTSASGSVQNGVNGTSNGVSNDNEEEDSTSKYKYSSGYVR